MGLLDRVESCYNKQVDKIVIELAKRSVRSAVEAIDQTGADSLTIPLRRRQGGLFNSYRHVSSQRLLRTVVADLAELKSLAGNNWAINEEASADISQSMREGGYGCPPYLGWLEQPHIVLESVMASVTEMRPSIVAAEQKSLSLHEGLG
jgi:hypothetical protein